MCRSDDPRGRRGLAAEHPVVAWLPAAGARCASARLDVFVDGDARALALAEGAFGAARDDDSYLSMVVSTGFGGGS
jgi:predicted NBD/HSP70 family sugar kinase